MITRSRVTSKATSCYLGIALTATFLATPGVTYSAHREADDEHNRMTLCCCVIWTSVLGSAHFIPYASRLSRIAPRAETVPTAHLNALEAQCAARLQQHRSLSDACSGYRRISPDTSKTKKKNQ